MGNATMLFLFIFLFGIGMLGVAATGMAAFRGAGPHFLPLFLFSLTWSLGILVITFHYFLYVYIDERLRISVPLGYAIYAVNVFGIVFLLRTVHRFAALRRVWIEAAASLFFAVAAAAYYLPSPLPAALSFLPTWAAFCGVGIYGISTLVRFRPADREAGAERTAGIVLFALLIVTAGADYALELSPLHPLTADHFAFAAWNALVLGLIVRRNAERRKSAGSEEALIGALADGFKLSPRERETLEGVLQGWSNKRIAVELSIEETTVKTYVSSLFLKCGAASRYELMSKFR